MIERIYAVQMTENAVNALTVEEEQGLEEPE